MPTLFKTPVIAEVYHQFGDREQKEFPSFRHAKREVLDAMYDRKSDVYGASFRLTNGTFLKEIHF